MKKCGKCGNTKLPTEFNKNSSTRDGLQKQCRECQKATNLKHFRNNPEQYRERARKSSQERRDWVTVLLDELKNIPCGDCGIRYPPYVMDFDHLRDKEFNIGNEARRTWKTKEQILAEVDKCEVVCSNCHRERTHRRRHTDVVQRLE